MKAIPQILGLSLAPISTICRGERKMVEMVEMGAGCFAAGSANVAHLHEGRNIEPH